MDISVKSQLERLDPLLPVLLGHFLGKFLGASSISDSTLDYSSSIFGSSKEAQVPVSGGSWKVAMDTSNGQGCYGNDHCQVAASFEFVKL